MNVESYKALKELIKLIIITGVCIKVEPNRFVAFLPLFGQICIFIYSLYQIPAIEEEESQLYNSIKKDFIKELESKKKNKINSNEEDTFVLLEKEKPKLNTEYRRKKRRRHIKKRW